MIANPFGGRRARAVLHPPADGRADRPAGADGEVGPAIPALRRCGGLASAAALMQAPNPSIASCRSFSRVSASGARRYLSSPSASTTTRRVRNRRSTAYVPRWVSTRPCGSNGGSPRSIMHSRVSDSSGDSARPSANSTTRAAAVTPGRPGDRRRPATRSTRQAAPSRKAASAVTSPAPTPLLRATSMTVRATVVAGQPNQSDRSLRGVGQARMRQSRQPPPALALATVRVGRGGEVSTGNPCRIAALSWLAIVPWRLRTAAAIVISGLAPCGRSSPSRAASGQITPKRVWSTIPTSIGVAVSRW